MVNKLHYTDTSFIISSFSSIAARRDRALLRHFRATAAATTTTTCVTRTASKTKVHFINSVVAVIKTR